MKCKACGTPLYKNNTEHHHFPVSKKNGGKRTIPLCLSCHNMIERVRIDAWPDSYVEDAMEAFRDSREATLLFLKFYWLMQEMECRMKEVNNEVV